MAHRLSQEPLEPHKRKRDLEDQGGQSPCHSERLPQPPPPQSGNEAPINYLSKANASKLSLIQGDGEEFANVISQIGDYEAVLNRHESFAVNLGAKLTGPRLLKAVEGVFEGSITITPQQPYTAPPIITWLDIVEFAKGSPNEFNITTTPDRVRVCQFFLRGTRVEIAEDDWRLIVSGALDRFMLMPPHPLEEDESAELATLEILEQRLGSLIKRADEIARRARQLNYRLSGRRAYINTRRSSPQPGPSGFASRNPQQHPQRSAIALGRGYDIHADLLQQFQAAAPPPAAQPRPSGAGPGLGPGGVPLASITTPAARLSPQTPLHSSHTPPRSGLYPEIPYRDTPPEDPAARQRPIIAARIEKLAKGEAIHPPCDRCRRLKAQCVKHLTACQGCTRKHAKCSWKSVTEEEMAWVRNEMGASVSEAASAGGDDDDGVGSVGGGSVGTSSAGGGGGGGGKGEEGGGPSTAIGHRIGLSGEFEYAGGGGGEPTRHAYARSERGSASEQAAGASPRSFMATTPIGPGAGLTAPIMRDPQTGMVFSAPSPMPPPHSPVMELQSPGDTLRRRSMHRENELRGLVVGGMREQQQQQQYIMGMPMREQLQQQQQQPQPQTQTLPGMSHMTSVATAAAAAEARESGPSGSSRKGAGSGGGRRDQGGR